MDDRLFARGSRLAGHAESVVDQRRLAAPVDGPADDPAAEGVGDHAAVDLALARWVLGDVGEPQRVGAVDGEIALDQVLFSRLVDQVLLVFLRARKALDAQLTHDRENQLLVDDHVLLTLEGGSDPQHSIGATGSLVDVGDQAHQQESTDLAVRGHVELVLVKARPRDPGNTTGHTLGVAQVAQCLGNLAPPFGLTGSSPLNRALAAFTAASSASSSSMVWRAWASSSTSMLFVPSFNPASMRAWSFHRYRVATETPVSPESLLTFSPATRRSQMPRRNSLA